MNQEEKIVSCADDVFLRRGLIKTSMDELAQILRMSKKTIYKFFPSKHELLKAVVKKMLTGIALQVEKVVSDNLNSVEKLYALSWIIADRLSKINSNWINNLQAYFPELWNMVDEFRIKMIRKNFDIILEQGKKENLIKDIPNSIMLTILINSVQSVVNPQFIIQNNITMRDAISSTIEVLVSGILTDKGTKIFNKLKKRELK